jgi:hypothetical protein
MGWRCSLVLEHLDTVLALNLNTAKNKAKTKQKIFGHKVGFVSGRSVDSIDHSTTLPQLLGFVVSYEIAKWEFSNFVLLVRFEVPCVSILVSVYQFLQKKKKKPSARIFFFSFFFCGKWV